MHKKRQLAILLMFLEKRPHYLWLRDILLFLVDKKKSRRKSCFPDIFSKYVSILCVHTSMWLCTSFDWSAAFHMGFNKWYFMFSKNNRQLTRKREIVLLESLCEILSWPVAFLHLQRTNTAWKVYYISWSFWIQDL